jgi:hypothetical protein
LLPLDSDEMRAKTVTHVEYEVFNAILDSELIAEVVNELKMGLVPEGDEVAQKRFEEGVKSAAKYINNLAERRKHRLPQEHTDFINKE